MNFSPYPPTLHSFLRLQKAGPFLADGRGRRLSTRCPQPAQPGHLGDCPPSAESCLGFIYIYIVFHASWWRTRLWPNFCAEVHRGQGVGFFFYFWVYDGAWFGKRRCNSSCIQMSLGSRVRAPEMSSGTCTETGRPALPLLCLITWVQSSPGVFKDP